MKKRNVFLLTLVFCTALSAHAAYGNGGKNKVGAYVGWPTGFSYSHEFNKVELDLMVAWNGYATYKHGIGGLNIHLGALFTVYNPVLDGQNCPLKIGPVAGFSGDFIWGKTGALTLFAPLRWDVNFKKAPDFNLFLDLGPGVGFYLYNGPGIAYFTGRAGVGLRYRIPN